MPVTDADVEHVRQAFAVFNEDFDDLAGDALRPYHERFFVPDSVVHNADGFPTDETYEGYAGYRRWFDDTYSPYEDVRWTLETVEAAGERVVAIGLSGGRAKGDPTWLEIRLGCTYAIRDGRIARIDVFLTPDAAFAHARAQG